MEYHPTIGLEIHVELKTRSKMFCSCPNNADERHPNVNICPVCTGQPGSLPVINEEAIEKVIKTGLALNCRIREFSKFDRKNYFYPDLPKGYQISQEYMPFCRGGFLKIANKEIRIRNIHLEEDVGKLFHPEGVEYSLVNFNRAGVPLMELVTEPDIRLAKEAREFAEEFQLILRYLGISDADMEKGEMRVEVNISLRPNGERIKMNEDRIVLKDESYRLMSLLFEVHNKLGPVYKEKNYQDAVEEILKREKISYEREKKITLKFENPQLSNFFADFIIDSNILLEIKAEKFITQNDIRQALRYIKSANLPLAIIVNFRGDKLEYKRLVNPLFDFNSLSFVEDSGELGVKVEIKNLNSFRAAEKAIEYEIKRQSKLLGEGKSIVQETRGWDDIKEKTVSQRGKEEAHDYRYFPEPDLPPLLLTEEKIENIRNEIGELPQARRIRFKKEYELGNKEIEIFVQNKDLGEFFEKASSELIRRAKDNNISGGKLKDVLKLSTNYLITDLQGLLKGASVVGEDFLITPENFAEFITLIYKGEISSKAAKIVLGEMFGRGSDPSHIIQEQNLKQVSGESELKNIVRKVIEDNPKPVEDYGKGKENALQFLVGRAMSVTRGKANPEVVKEMLKKILKK